jgi:hypothetical protein
MASTSICEVTGCRFRTNFPLPQRTRKRLRADIDPLSGTAPGCGEINRDNAPPSPFLAAQATPVAIFVPSN